MTEEIKQTEMMATDTNFADLIELALAERQVFEAPTPLGFIDWYMGKLAGIDTRREIAKRNAAAIQRLFDNEEASLVWLFGRQFKQAVDEDLAANKGKAKSRLYDLGRAGYRGQPERLNVEDEQAVLTWAESNCPEAVKTTKSLLKIPLIESWKASGALPPGCKVEGAYEKFYPVADISALPAPTVKRLALAAQERRARMTAALSAAEKQAPALDAYLEAKDVEKR